MSKEFVITLDITKYAISRNHLILLAEEYYGKLLDVAGSSEQDFETEIAFAFIQKDDETDEYWKNFAIILNNTFKKIES